ncbi:MAG: DUF883 family protein [Proteobacteria bacterium]|nr:DUF883 family protein [Pseudomonadota bacterium]MBU1057158.1 DUF883 family protein [Pseudomonadota bacterium]
MASTHDNTQKMSEEMQQIIDHARELVDATSGELDDRVKAAREALKERLDSSKSEYCDLEKQFLGKVMDADEFIHVKPYYAIGGTFIGGLLLGWFMSRK